MKVSDDGKLEFDARELVLLMEVDARLGVLEEQLLPREQVLSIRREWAETLRAVGISRKENPRGPEDV
jgi:hypothetical protein